MNREEVCYLSDELIKIRALAESNNSKTRGALCIKPNLSDITGGGKIPTPSSAQLWEFLNISEVKEVL